MERLRVGILGFGNLGRGAAAAVSQSPDMALAGIFTRRPPEQVAAEAGGMPVCPAALLEEGGPPVDVLLLCGGSAGDLPRQSPRYAGRFHIVDSFDTHARAPEHFAAVDAAARRGGRAAVICAGWDPGLFSVLRALALAALPRGESHTFWGEGVSQGHSEAVRRLPGVLDARAYTVPIPDALEAARAGEGAELTPGSMHRRVCCVALEEGAEPEAVRRAIVTMPHYFADYDTTVHFVTREELARDHSGLPHGGLVLRTGRTGRGEAHRASLEFRLRLDSNPEFTGGVLAACARAAWRLGQAGEYGCKTLLDIPPALLLPFDRGEEGYWKLI